MSLKGFFCLVLLSLMASLTSVFKAEACTGITLNSSDGSVIMARTIEWAAEDNHNRYVIVPRGHIWHSFIPGGNMGREFRAQYGYVGIAVQQAEFIVEGLNEKGLAGGLFYFPDYGKYENFNPQLADSSISDLQLVSYILGKCANVDEVIAEVKKIHIHNIDPRASTAHWRFGEPGGRQIVLEIIDAKPVFYENSLGVLTNSPSFDWHLTNLNNYVNLIPGTVNSNTIDKMHLKTLSGGSGFLGIPGDLTSVSRFVRAAFFQSTAPVMKKPLETVFQAFHILNNFDLPLGAQTSPGNAPAPIPSATQFTDAIDLSGRKIYFTTMYNNTIRCIDLGRINFSKVKFQSKALDEIKRQTVQMLF